MSEKEDRSRKAQGHVSNMQRGKKSSKYSSGADCIRKILCIIGDWSGESKGTASKVQRSHHHHVLPHSRITKFNTNLPSKIYRTVFVFCFSFIYLFFRIFWTLSFWNLESRPCFIVKTVVCFHSESSALQLTIALGHSSKRQAVVKKGKTLIGTNVRFLKQSECNPLRLEWNLSVCLYLYVLMPQLVKLSLATHRQTPAKDLLLYFKRSNAA